MVRDYSDQLRSDWLLRLIHVEGLSYRKNHGRIFFSLFNYLQDYYFSSLSITRLFVLSRIIFLVYSQKFHCEIWIKSDVSVLLVDLHIPC